MDTDQIHRTRPYGGYDEVFINDTCSDIIKVTNNKLYYQTALVSFEDGTKTWRPEDIYSIDFDGKNRTKLNIPYNARVEILTDDYIFYDSADKIYKLDLKTNNISYIGMDMTNLILIGSQLFYCYQSDDYRPYVMNTDDSSVKKLADTSFIPILHYGEYIYCNELTWIDGQVGKTWQYGRLARLNIKDYSITYLEKLTELGFVVEDIIQANDGYIFYSTRDGIYRVNLSTLVVDTLFSGINETFYVNAEYIYFYNIVYNQNKREYVGIYRVKKDNSSKASLIQDFSSVSS